MVTDSTDNKYLYRKWIGVIWLSLEIGLLSGNVFGFTSIFKILPKYGVYDSYCTIQTITNWTNTTIILERNCDEQTKKYEAALTLGIIFFDLASMFIGALIDLFGPRSIKLIGVVLHVIGWLSLGLVRPGRDYLLIVHTLFSSLSGSIVLITAFASSAYFSHSRGLISTIFVGVSIISTIWYAIFQILINSNVITLYQLSYIWTSFGFLLFVSSFLFLDWKFPLLNLPYGFDVKLENLSSKNEAERSETTKLNWYSQMCNREGIWKHLTSPLYIMVVLFLSTLLLPIDFLSITWYSRVYYLTNQNILAANQYANAFSLAILVGIIVCPLSGFLVDFKAHRNRKQKVLNILILQMITWSLNIISCIVGMFVMRALIIPQLILNCITRSIISAGPQAVVATFFPSKYIGTLSGIMWTMVGATAFVQYGLRQLVQDVTKPWRAWLVLLGLVTMMSSHVIQIWFIYRQENRVSKSLDKEMTSQPVSTKDIPIKMT